MDGRKVGVVGLGNMGGGIARNFQRAGVPLAVWDVVPAAREALAEMPGVEVATPGQMAASCGTIFFIVPATPEIVHDLQTTRWGDQTIWDILVGSGVQMTENAGCAACLGGPVDTFGRMNTPMKCISATNRNFPGRMGHKESQVFLASPATVAASAVAGRVADPREYSN